VLVGCGGLLTDAISFPEEFLVLLDQRDAQRKRTRR
jgi:hypothetical protein